MCLQNRFNTEPQLNIVDPQTESVLSASHAETVFIKDSGIEDIGSASDLAQPGHDLTVTTSQTLLPVHTFSPSSLLPCIEHSIDSDSGTTELISLGFIQAGTTEIEGDETEAHVYNEALTSPASDQEAHVLPVLAYYDETEHDTETYTPPADNTVLADHAENEPHTEIQIPPPDSPVLADHAENEPDTEIHTPPADNTVYTADGLRCLYSNVDCLPNKMEELRARISTPDYPHVIALTEVNPKRCRYPVTQAEISLAGYNLHTAGLDTEGDRGLAVYTHTSVDASLLERETASRESLSVKIRLPDNSDMLFTCLYRSPNSDEVNNAALNSHITNLCNENFTYTVMCGDLNFPRINWENWYAGGNMDSSENKFLETLSESNLYQHVSGPTRSRGDNEPSLLDLVLTNEEDMVTHIVSEAPVGKSDHTVLVWTVNCHPIAPTEPRMRYIYQRGNYRKMQAELACDWAAVFRDCIDDPERQYTILLERLQRAQDNNIPRTDKTRAKRRFPLDREVRELIRKKKRAWARYSEDRTEGKRLIYTRLRNRVSKLTKLAKKRHEGYLASEAKDNPKKLWRYVSSKLKTRPGVSDLIIPDATDEQGKPRVTKDDQEKADTLADFFSSVFTIEPDTDVPTKDAPELEHPFTEGTITDVLVAKLLADLKESKAGGPDGAHPKVLRELSQTLATPLALIFNTSLRTGILPEVWKLGNVSAIYKKGSKSQPGNYRPVSLTSVVCKCMEKIIRDWILDHFTKNNLINPAQYGFVKGRSTTLQLLRVIEDWTAAVDRGEKVDVIYFDFAKAFDTVPHRRLLAKLEAYGITGLTLAWVKSFLTGREQMVSVGGKKSRRHPVTSGIPQGSVLGPTLYVVYVNDLPDAVICRMLLFADDTKIYRVIIDANDRIFLQQDVERMRRWAMKWLQNYAPEKCKSMTVGSARVREMPESLYSLGDVNLSHVRAEKDVGVLVDDTLSFDDHVAQMAKKANRVANCIRRSFTFMDEDMFRLLFKAMVRPHLEYAQSVWKPHKRCHIDLLEQVQHRATKRVPGLQNLSYTERLKRLNLPTLAYRRLRGDMIEVFKITSGIYDTAASSGILHPSNQRRTRGNSKRLEKQHCRLNVRKYSFSQRVVNSWNSLPDSIVTAPSLHSFENRLDRHWRGHPLQWDEKEPEHHLPDTPR